MKSQRKEEKIKNKIIKIFLVIILSIKIVSAEEIEKVEELKDITDNVEIRYKWYKEKVFGDYYPLKEENEGYFVDVKKIKAGSVSTWDTGKCSLPKNHYFVEYAFRMTYESVQSIKYVEIKNITFNDNIKVYYNNQLLNYRIVTNKENQIVIDLEDKYRADTLIFYIDTDKEYQITLYSDKYLTSPVLSKQVSSNYPLIPDETWKLPTTPYENHYTTIEFKETTLTKKKKQQQICRATEILAYKYKIEREYYDNDYHTYVEGYIKDEDDYKIFYKEEPIINTIEIIKEITKEKIVKEPEIKYIYLPSKNEIQKFDSSKNKENEKQQKTECTPQIKTKVKTEIKTVEKEILKTPKKIYMIIAILILSIIFLIKKIKKLCRWKFLTTIVEYIKKYNNMC